MTEAPREITHSTINVAIDTKAALQETAQAYANKLGLNKMSANDIIMVMVKVLKEKEQL